MKITNILLLTDFSESAIKALKKAVELTKKTNATLIILHTYRVLKPLAKPKENQSYSLKETLEFEPREKFRILKEEHLQKENINFKFLIEPGFTVDSIKNIIMSNQIDLIIMGAKGAGSSKKKLGSTTYNVISEIDCPILTIPDSDSFQGVEKILLSI